MIDDPDLTVRRVHRTSRRHARVRGARLREATVVLPAATRFHRLRRRMLAIGAAAVLLAGAAWYLLARSAPFPAGAAVWMVDVAATRGPAWALVTGGAGGLRLLRIPELGDAGGPRRLVARLDEEPMRLVSVGVGLVDVRATAPGRGDPGGLRSATARGRVVRLSPEGDPPPP